MKAILAYILGQIFILHPLNEAKLPLRGDPSAGRFSVRGQFYRPRNWPDFSGQFIGLLFQADSQADSEASSQADSLEASLVADLEAISAILHSSDSIQFSLKRGE